MDDDHELPAELLTAIGEVAVEAAKLEYALARLVAAARGWDEERVHQIASHVGRVRREVRALAADQDWRELQLVIRDAISVLEDRDRLLHSVVVETDPDDGTPIIEFWHTRSNTHTVIQAGAVEEHAFDISRCFGRVIRLIPHAQERYTRRIVAETDTAAESPPH